MTLSDEAKAVLGTVDRAADHGTVLPPSKARDELETAGLIYVRRPGEGGDGPHVLGRRPRWFLSVEGHEQAMALEGLSAYEPRIDPADSIVVEEVIHQPNVLPPRYWRALVGQGGPILSTSIDLGRLVADVRRAHPREAIIIQPGEVRL